jgi:hypothetical protein
VAHSFGPRNGRCPRLGIRFLHQSARRDKHLRHLQSAGTITLSCALTSSPAGATDLPTCSSTQTATLSSSATSTSATVTVSTTAASSALAWPKLGKGRGWGGASSGAVLAVLIILRLPRRRSYWKSMLGMVVAMTILGGLAACGGGGGNGGGGGGGTINPGTTAGTYTFTVTGTGNDSAKTTATATPISKGRFCGAWTQRRPGNKLSLGVFRGCSRRDAPSDRGVQGRSCNRRSKKWCSHSNERLKDPVLSVTPC